MSRLDIILLSKEATELGVESQLDWGFDNLDHAMLETNFKIKNINCKGKGLFRVKTKVLEKSKCSK